MTARYNDDTVARVRDASDIVSVVSDYVQLKKAGNRFVGLCPFHGERTPSFSVSGDKQLFYCFGCHAGGNVFTFIMKMEGLDFREAVARLAARSGIDVSYEGETEVDRAARERRERAFAANEVAMAYFSRMLNESRVAAAGAARAYLTKRGIGREAAERFRLGFAPATGNGLVAALSAKGFSPKEAVECGLALTDDRSGRVFDRFRNRVMFPIVNVRGKVVGFGGRSYDGTSPKYLNSPESASFSKRHNLYGLDIAADAVKSAGSAILVEGYIDVISLVMAGVPNVVATLGTALTLEQARLIGRFAGELVLFYDGDAAGSAATARAVGIVQSVGLSVKVVPVPGEHDPDSFVRAEGPDALQRLLADAQAYASYSIDRILAAADLSKLDDRVRAADEVAATLAAVSGDVERAEYLREASDRLGVDPQVLAAAVRRAAATARTEGAGAPGAQLKPEAFRAAGRYGAQVRAYFEVERWLLFLALTQAGAAQALAAEVARSDGKAFVTAPNAELMAMVLQAQGEGKPMDAATLVDAADPELAGYVSELVGSEQAFDTGDGAIQRAIELWRRKRAQERLAEIDIEIKQAESTGAADIVRALMEEQVELRQALGRDIALY